MKRDLSALILGLVLTMSFISCSGDGGSESIDPAWEDKIKTILLRSEGWIGEWHCSTNDTLTDLIFKDRGNKLEVKIHNHNYDAKCERKVKITSGGFEMSGCYANTVPLIYDPNNDRYPFEGDNGTCNLKLKAK